MATPARKSRGRQKVAMQRMQKKSNMLVTFSKRRAGVFKKASELCTLCGVQALCIVFSPTNKAFAFGHPSVEAIINRFLLEDNNFPQDNRVSTEPFQNQTLLRSNIEVSILKDRMDIEKKRTEELLKERKLKSEEAQKFLAPAETFTYSELKQIQATLIVLRNNVYTHRKNLVQAQSNLSLNPNPSPMILDAQNILGQNPFFNPPNMLARHKYYPNPTHNPTLIQSHAPPTFRDTSQMTMARDPNDTPMMMIPTPMSAFNGPTLGMRANLMNPGSTDPNTPPPFQWPTNPMSGSFDDQNNMLTDMGWNPMAGKTFTSSLTDADNSNSPALPFNSQGRYMENNPIPCNYQISTNLMWDGSSNSLAPPFNPQGRFMGNNHIPGDYQTSIPPFDPQGEFDYAPGFDPGMN